MIMTFSLFFSGCTKVPICEEQNTPYIKYVLDKETSKCIISEEIEKDVCGNGIAEESNDETFCSCPEDVTKTHPTLGCKGEKGDYLEYRCSKQDKCELFQNAKIVNQIKSIEFKNTDLKFNVDFSIPSPFILDTLDNNVIKADLTYFKGSTSNLIKLSNIVVKELNLKNSAGIKFGENKYNEIVSTPGQKLNSKNFELAKTTKYFTTESLKSELVISYTKSIFNSKGEVTKTEQKIETLKASLGNWEIINPNFEVPKKR